MHFMTDSEKYVDSFRKRGIRPPSLMERFGNNLENLKSSTVIQNEDLILTFNPSVPGRLSDLEKIHLIVEMQSGEEFRNMERKYELRLTNLWHILERQSKIRTSLSRFLVERKANYRGVWVIDRVTGEIKWTLNEDEYYLVLLNDWAIKTGLTPEVAKMGTIFFPEIGNQPEAILSLVRQGVRSIIIADSNVITSPNTVIGATDDDVGINVAVWTAYHALKINPHLKVVAFPRNLSPYEKEEIIKLLAIINDSSSDESTSNQ